MENKLIAGIVAAAVVVIVIAGVLMPILGDATTTHDTFENKGYFNISYSTTDEVDLTWDHTKPNIVTVNDVDYDMSGINLNGLNNNRITIVGADDWVVRFQVTSNEISYWSPTKSIYGNANNGVDFSLTASNGSATAANTASTPATETISYTNLYCIDKEGDLVMKEATEAAYLNGDSSIYAIGTTQVNNTPSIIKLEGSITDGVTGDIYRISGATIDNIQLVYTENGNHKDLYELSKITADATVSGNVTEVTYSYFIVPSEVTAERTVHLDPAMNAVLNVIPLLIIVAVLLGVTAVFILRRE